MWCCHAVKGIDPLPRAAYVRVIGYKVRDASHDTARDGSVTVSTDSNEDVEVLWSNGAIIEGFELHNVRPGRYAAIVITANGRPVHCIHATSPSRVGILSGTP